MSVNEYEFTSAKEMLDTLHRDADLYSPSIGAYVFHYNEAGAIAAYGILPDEAVELALETEKHDGEYWAAFLGPGGGIYDDPEDEYSPPSPGNSNIEWCERYFRERWISTEDVLAFYANDPRFKDSFAKVGVQAYPYARLYGEISVPKSLRTSEEIEKYIKDHFNAIEFEAPDLDYDGTDFEFFTDIEGGEDKK